MASARPTWGRMVRVPAVGACTVRANPASGRTVRAPPAGGVYGKSQASIGVYGESTDFEGVRGTSHHKDHGGVVGVNDAVGGIAVYGIAPNGGYAAWFNGRTKTNVMEIVGGSDLAERFATADNATVEPGTVMVIDEDHAGKLKVSDGAYDGKVIGIVSGAGGINTGLTLHQEGALEGDLVVAIAGRVYCTSRSQRGPDQARRFADHLERQGALHESDRSRSGVWRGDRQGVDGLWITGEGLVLVIVNLQ